MFELRSLWVPIFRAITVSGLVLLLAVASAAPVMAETPDGDLTGTSWTEPGPDLNHTEDGEEDIDEWENDILKSTFSPPAGWLRESLAAWGRAVGAFLGLADGSGPAPR